MDTELDKNLVLVVSDHPEDLIKEISSFSEPKLTDVVAVCGHIDLPENVLAKTGEIPVGSGAIIVSCDNHPKGAVLTLDLESLSDTSLDTTSLVQFIVEHTQQIIDAQEINVPDIAEFSLKMVEDSCKMVANLSEILLKKSNDKPYFVPRQERIRMVDRHFSRRYRFNRKILRR